MDAVVFNKQALKSKSVRYDVVRNLNEMWLPASIITPKDYKTNKHAKFAFKLGARCLPCPRGIQLTNDYLGDQMYPGYMCPLCNIAWGEEYHILCKCGVIWKEGTDAFEECFQDIKNALKTHKVPVGPYGRFWLKCKLRAALFPASSYGFAWGGVPKHIHALCTGSGVAGS